MKKRRFMIALLPLAFSSCDQGGSNAGFDPALSEVVKNLETNGSHFSVTHIDKDFTTMAETVDQLLAEIRKGGEEVPEQLNVVALLGDLGLDKVQATGRSSRWNETAWHNRYFVQTGGARGGVLSVLGGEGSEWRVAQHAPSDADMVAEIEVDLTELKSTIELVSSAFGEEGKRGYEDMIRDQIAGGALTIGELLGKTNLRATLMVSMDEEKRWRASEQIELPTIHAAMRIERGRWLWERFGKMIESDAEVSERDGNKVVMAPEEMETPMGKVRPIIVLNQKEDVIWVALTEAYLDRCQSGESTLSSSEDFQKATTGFPETGNGLLYVSASFCKELSGQMERFAKMIPEGGEKTMLVQIVMSLLAMDDIEASHGYAWCVANVDQGILSVANAPFADKNYGMMSGIMPIATMAGMTAPMVIQARDTAHQTKAMSDMRQLSVALMMHQAETGTFPAELEDLVKKGMITRESLIELNGQDAGGLKVPFTYVSGLSADADSETIILHSSAPVDGKRLCARVDGSVVTLAEIEFQEVLQKQKLAE